MDIRQKMAIIVVASILFTAVPGSILVYRYAKAKILNNEISKLLKITRRQADVASLRFQESQPKLENLANLIQSQLNQSSKSEVLAQFNQKLELGNDGVWRNRKPAFDGKREAGVFLPQSAALNLQQKRNHVLIKSVLDIYGAAASKRLENVWYLSPQRSEIIFDRNFPEFAFEQDANNDYTQTPWLTYTSPALNAQRELVFTPPLFDPVPKVWMVSALYPLYWGDEWLGSLGEDMQLSNVLGFMFEKQQIFDGTQTFLRDNQGNFILAGNWQTQLEHQSTASHFNLDLQPQLKAVLQANLQTEPKLLADQINLDGKIYVAVGMLLQPVNWRYFILVPLDEIMQSTHEIFLALIVVICLVSVFSGLFIGVAVHNNVVKRIRLLADAMRSYESASKAPLKPLVIPPIKPAD